MRSYKSRLRRRRLAERFRRNPAPFFALALACAVGCGAALRSPEFDDYLTMLCGQCSAFYLSIIDTVQPLKENTGDALHTQQPAAQPYQAQAADDATPVITTPPELNTTPSKALPIILSQVLDIEKATAMAMPLSFAEPATLQFKNCTDYSIAPAEILKAGSGIHIDSSGPQILVIHTHGSEAYTQDNTDTYVESDPYRTTDNEHNMVRVGDELCSILDSRGIQTVHDTTLFDYPNYNDSYTRSMEAIDGWLEEYPSIKIVLDLHRDAIEYSDGSAFKTECTVDGLPSAQILIISGTNDSGLYHPNWRDNLAFGFTLQSAMDAAYPGLTRPLKISQYRYNMHATTGSLLIEVGSHGNTLQEALTAIRCFGNTLADVLLNT